MSNYTKEDREKMLDAGWQAKMPCTHCPVSEICRYKFAIKRVDYPEDVFDVTIRCKISSKYSAVPSENEDDEYVRQMNKGMC